MNYTVYLKRKIILLLTSPFPKNSLMTFRVKKFLINIFFALIHICINGGRGVVDLLFGPSSNNLCLTLSVAIITPQVV